jgi:molybdopterin-guanine dinucleotide biosynthesis protein
MTVRISIKARPTIVAVSGFSSNVGKTTLVCELLRQFSRQARSAAKKRSAASRSRSAKKAAKTRKK